MVNYKLHLIRHGKTRWNLEGRYVGGADLPLCDEGRAELEALLDTREYPRVQQVYISPLRRCRETAELIYPNCYTEEIEELSEYDFGAFEGKNLEELQQEPGFAEWLTDSLGNIPPGGEDPMAFTERIVAGLERVFRDMMEHRITSAAVVIPGGVITSLLAGLAMPRLPYNEWATESGCGFTVVMTPQMWMRDRLVEATNTLPYHLENVLLEDDFEAFTIEEYREDEEE